MLLEPLGHASPQVERRMVDDFRLRNFSVSDGSCSNSVPTA